MPPPSNTTLPATKVGFRQRWAWARLHTKWFPWGVELVTGSVSMLLMAVVLWRRQPNQNQSFQTFLDSAVWWEFAVPIVVGGLVALVLTPTVGFGKNLVVAKSNILAERMVGLFRHNVILASALDMTEHKKKVIYDRLAEVIRSGRMLQGRTYDPRLSGSWWGTEYRKWIENSLAPLEKVLPPHEWDNLSKPLHPVAPRGRMTPPEHYMADQSDLSVRLERLSGIIVTYRAPVLHFGEEVYGIVEEYSVKPSTSDSEAPPSTEGAP